jgi:hypothetical protein
MFLENVPEMPQRQVKDTVGQAAADAQLAGSSNFVKSQISLFLQ